MTKDVWITISGLMTGGRDTAEPVATAVWGTCYERNGCRYVFYEERQEDFAGVTKTRIRIRRNGMDILRQGVLNVHMVFEEGQRTKSAYGTPFGTIHLEIRTDRYILEEEEGRIRVRVCYRLDADGQSLSDCTVSMQITSAQEIQTL